MADKIALVTGASTGIGAAVCTALAGLGVRVAVCDINRADGEALAARLGGAFIQCDVTSLTSVQEAVSRCVETFGVPDYVHLNAGIMSSQQGVPDAPKVKVVYGGIHAQAGIPDRLRQV